MSDDTIIFLVLPLICSVQFIFGWIAATIYFFKRNRFFTGLLAGFLLGPFGILLVLLMPGRPKSVRGAGYDFDWHD